MAGIHEDSYIYGDFYIHGDSYNHGDSYIHRDSYNHGDSYINRDSYNHGDSYNGGVEIHATWVQITSLVQETSAYFLQESEVPSIQFEH